MSGKNVLYYLMMHSTMLFALFYFYAYSHLRFKHTILGTHLSCLFRKMSLYFLSVVGDREEGVVALHQPMGI